MFLSLFTDREKELFYTLSVYLVESDGIVTGEERTILDSYVLESNSYDIKKLQETPNEIINQLSNSSSKIKNCILLELISLALSDGHYTDNEKLIISKVVEEFGVSEYKFNELFNWVKDLKDMYSKILNLVEIS